MEINRESIFKILNNKYESIEGEDYFSDWFDGYDLLDLVFNCQKEFNCTIDPSDKDEYSFDTIEDFINWILPEINNSEK